MPECLCQVQQESHPFLFLRRLGGGELIIFFLVISRFNFLLHLVWHFSSTNTMFLKYDRFLLKSWKLLIGIKEQQSTGNNLKLNMRHSFLKIWIYLFLMVILFLRDLPTFLLPAFHCLSPYFLILNPFSICNSLFRY